MTGKKFKLGVALLIIAIALTVVFVYGYSVNTNQPLSVSSFPKNIQGLNLQQVVSGPQALSMISRLHGSDIPVKQGYIASYAGSQGQIMIWISESEKTDQAKQLLQIMDRKISAAGNSGPSGQPPFTDRRELTVNGIKVIAVKGMGMENYYYQDGTKVYWVAAGGVAPVKALEDVMKAL